MQAADRGPIVGRLQREANMRTLVAYRSRYGHARTYAEWIAEDLQADLVDLAEDESPGLTDVDVAVLVAPIYAGGLLGAKPFAARAEVASDVALVGVTVGASDPANPKNQQAYLGAIDKAFSDSLRARMRWFHLRGGIDYPRLSMLHRLALWAVSRKAKLDARKGDAEAQTMVDTYGGVVDFRDRATIVPLVEHVRGLAPDTT